MDHHLPASAPSPELSADSHALQQRRFGGLDRLYGQNGAARIRAAHVAVVGIGGVGSWAAEALARSGVGRLTLIDLDHVAESNINRQVQALGSTLGMAKAQALRARVADIHPGCRVHAVEEFASVDNWPALLPVPVDAVIDACDQSHAKLALARWALVTGVAYVCCGAAGGKREAQRVEVADLGEATHDPLLASLRQRLRKALATSGPRSASASARHLGVRCVFSREAVAAPPDATCAPDGGLNCHGYGSTVTVTATFGLVAAGEVMRQLALRATGASPGSC